MAQTDGCSGRPSRRNRSRTIGGSAGEATAGGPAMSARSPHSANPSPAAPGKGKVLNTNLPPRPSLWRLAVRHELTEHAVWWSVDRPRPMPSVGGVATRGPRKHGPTGRDMPRNHLLARQCARRWGSAIVSNSADPGGRSAAPGRDHPVGLRAADNRVGGVDSDCAAGGFRVVPAGPAGHCGVGVRLLVSQLNNYTLAPIWGNGAARRPG